MSGSGSIVLKIISAFFTALAFYLAAKRNLEARNYSSVNTGVIEFGGDGSGQAKKPKLAYDGLEIHIPITGANRNFCTAAP